MTEKNIGHRVFGVHAVSALLSENSRAIKKLYIKTPLTNARLQQLLEQAIASQVSVQQVSERELEHLMPSVSHQGVIADCIARKAGSEKELEALLERRKNPFLLILDGVQDPHNLGACLRSANAAGVDAVIAPADKAVGLTPIVRKVASGAAEITPFITVTNLARTLKFLKKAGVWIYGLDAQASQFIYQSSFNGSIAVVLGGEGKGIRRLTRELCDYLIAIPMSGAVQSLNVSVATGICLFEVLRQRDLKTARVF